MNITLPTPTTPDLHPGLLPSALQRLRQRRDERAAVRRLERDLAAYTTRADRDELYALLDRYDDAETETIRRVLAKQAR